MNRLILLAAILAAIALVTWPVPVSAQDPAPGPEAGDGDASGDDDGTGETFEREGAAMLGQAGREAVTRGLAWLADSQNRDGSFGGRGNGNYVIAITALSGLALVAGGNLPGRGPYGDNVQATINFLLSTQGNLGFFSIDGDGSRTHGHGFATLFLAQVLGMVNDVDQHMRLKRSVMKAVRIIEQSQTPEGGWGYVPDDRTWDEASTTVTLVQGLRAARDAGVRVSRDTIDRAIRYVHRCAMRVEYTDQDGHTRTGYTFKYSLKYNNNRSTFPLTAAAVSSLQGSGRYEGEVLQGGLDWLDAFFHEYMDNPPNQQWYERFYFYSHFYAAQAFFHAPAPRYWNSYYPAVRDKLLRRQNSRNGTWPSSYGEQYGTAIATLVLQIPYGYLPIFQR